MGALPVGFTFKTYNKNFDAQYSSLDLFTALMWVKIEKENYNIWLRTDDTIGYGEGLPESADKSLYIDLSTGNIYIYNNELEIFEEAENIDNSSNIEFDDSILQGQIDDLESDYNLLNAKYNNLENQLSNTNNNLINLVNLFNTKVKELDTGTIHIDGSLLSISLKSMDVPFNIEFDTIPNVIISPQNPSVLGASQVTNITTTQFTYQYAAVSLLALSDVDIGWIAIEK